MRAFFLASEVSLNRAADAIETNGVDCLAAMLRNRFRFSFSCGSKTCATVQFESLTVLSVKKSLGLPFFRKIMSCVFCVNGAKRPNTVNLVDPIVETRFVYSYMLKK